MMLPPHSLVAAHLFVHLFLHVLFLLLCHNRRRPDGRKVVRTVLEEISRDAGRHLVAIPYRARVIVGVGIGQWQAVGRGTLRASRNAHRVNRVLRGDAVALAAVATCLFVGSVCVSESNRNTRQGYLQRILLGARGFCFFTCSCKCLDDEGKD